MRRSELEPTQAIDRAAEARRAREVARARGTAPPSSAARPTIAERVIVSVNASYLTASRTFDDTRTFDLYAEQGSFTTDYDVEASVGVDAGAFVRVWQNLAVGGAFTTHKDDGDLVIEGSIPHPLLFNQPRSIEGTAPGTREETAFHLQVAYIVPVNRKLRVVVFGGPSFFTVKQSVVTGDRRTTRPTRTTKPPSRARTWRSRRRRRPASTSAPTSATSSRRTSAWAASSASRRRR